MTRSRKKGKDPGKRIRIWSLCLGRGVKNRPEEEEAGVPNGQKEEQETSEKSETQKESQLQMWTLLLRNRRSHFR